MTIEQEATVLVEKCQAKLKLAATFDVEAEGFSDKAKDAKKRAAALRAEVERLIVDPGQTEIALEPDANLEEEEQADELLGSEEPVET